MKDRLIRTADEAFPREIFLGDQGIRPTIRVYSESDMAQVIRRVCACSAGESVPWLRLADHLANPLDGMERG